MWWLWRLRKSGMNDYKGEINRLKMNKDQKILQPQKHMRTYKNDLLKSKMDHSGAFCGTENFVNWTLLGQSKVKKKTRNMDQWFPTEIW